MADSGKKIALTTVVEGKEVNAGTIFFHSTSLTFAYDEEFIALPKSYDLFPSLPRTSFAPFHFAGLGSFSDSAPDRWGRTLINRALKRNRVSEIEYLLNADDVARQGALRFYVDDVAQALGSDVPLVINLPELLTIADDVVMQNDITDENASKLFHATGSLGGTRPKACVKDRNALYVAKFPKPQGDAWDVIGWEYVTLKLGNQFGISVPEAKIVSVKDAQNRNRNVMLTRRFDRNSEGGRIHYMSAMTALQMSDGAGGDWQDFAEITRELGGDVVELWRRAVFGTAIGNLDNHLRNHSFLMTNCGWQLSPAFDMNPEPVSHASDTYQLSLFGENELTLKNFSAKNALELFGITQEESEAELGKLSKVLKGAIRVAKSAKLDPKSIETIASRFQA